MNTQIKDKLLLLISSSIASILIFGSSIYLLSVTKIPTGWFFFLGGAITYVLAATYGAITTLPFKKRLKEKYLMLLFFTILLFVVFSFFFLFYFHILELPNNLFVYLIASFLLALLTLNILYFLSSINKKR